MFIEEEPFVYDRAGVFYHQYCTVALRFYPLNLVLTIKCQVQFIVSSIKTLFIIRHLSS